MIVIWGCSAARAPEFRHRNWRAKRKITWRQQALALVRVSVLWRFRVLAGVRCAEAVTAVDAGLYAKRRLGPLLCSFRVR